jgi:DnaJ family protein C protein 28
MNELADDHIEKAMEAGAFDNLPGAGKPLQLEHDRLVPEEYRLAYRIMRDNDIQPEWIMLQKGIIAATEQARRALWQTAQRYYTVQEKLQGQQDYHSVSQRLAVMDERDEAKEAFRQAAHKINQQVRQFNLKVPFSHLTRDLLDADHEIGRVFPP